MRSERVQQEKQTITMADSDDQEPMFQDTGEMNEDNDPVDNSNDVTAQKLEGHEQLFVWRQLLMQIWQEQSADRIPLAYPNFEWVHPAIGDHFQSRQGRRRYK
jgi:hypothetical protein